MVLRPARGLVGAALGVGPVPVRAGRTAAEIRPICDDIGARVRALLAGLTGHPGPAGAG